MGRWSPFFEGEVRELISLSSHFALVVLYLGWPGSDPVAGVPAVIFSR
jgi:hypothetical protein